MTRPKRVALTSVGIILCVAAARGRDLAGVVHRVAERARRLLCARLGLCRRDPQGLRDNRRASRSTCLYDSEATKSLGLVNQLKNRKDDRRTATSSGTTNCWGRWIWRTKACSNRTRGAGYERIPAQYKDERGPLDGLRGPDARRGSSMGSSECRKTAGHRRRAASTKTSRGRPSSNPLYGTTLTHFSILWQLRGGTVAEVVVCGRSQEGNSHSGGQRAGERRRRRRRV